MVRGRRWRRRESAAGCGRMNQTIGGLAQVDSGGGVTSLGTTSGGRIHYDSSCNNLDWKPGYTKSVCKGQGTHPARYSTRVCGSQIYAPHRAPTHRITGLKKNTALVHIIHFLLHTHCIPAPHYEAPNPVVVGDDATGLPTSIRTRLVGGHEHVVLELLPATAVAVPQHTLDQKIHGV